MFVQYTMHGTQITQERSDYDLMTNSVKFMQHIYYVSIVRRAH